MTRARSIAIRVAGAFACVLAFGLGLANRIDVPIPAGARADRLLVDKSDRTLTLFADGRVLATLPIALGSDPVGPKEREGDGRTPEGRYVVDEHRTASRFHRALHLSYPTATQRSRAAARGVDPGGAIMIHGLRNGLSWIGRLHRTVDWTAGCIALTDPEIEAVFDAVPDGTPIEIRP